MNRFECVFNDGKCVARQLLLIPREMHDGLDCDDEQRGKFTGDHQSRFRTQTQLTENIEFEFNVRIVNARLVGDLTTERMIVIGRCELQGEKRRT